MKFTESVRSFQVPATPLTWAWPPSLPSVPTSRATRVTSEANEPSWSTILLTILAVRRNSPCNGRSSISSAIVCDRSPWATAPMTRAVSLVGWTRSSMRSLTESMAACHEPLTSPSEARWVILPSLPTTRLRRSSSRAMRSFISVTSLKASATLPATPVHSIGRRTEKSPFLRACIALSRMGASIVPAADPFVTTS